MLFESFYILIDVFCFNVKCAYIGHRLGPGGFICRVKYQGKSPQAYSCCLFFVEWHSSKQNTLSLGRSHLLIFSTGDGAREALRAIVAHDHIFSSTSLSCTQQVIILFLISITSWGFVSLLGMPFNRV